MNLSYLHEPYPTPGKTATDTELLNCDDDECDVEISGAKVPLQRITILLPPGGGHDAIEGAGGGM